MGSDVTVLVVNICVRPGQSAHLEVVTVVPLMQGLG